MMETLTQNCGLYLAHKLNYSEGQGSRSWPLGYAGKSKRIVRKRRGLRRFHLQEDNAGLCADRFLLL
jgi:hypothetical protein